jgi:magnesium chelatase family protein
LLASADRGEGSAAIRERVIAARERQRVRFTSLGGVECNARAPGGWLLRDGGAQGAVMREVARLSASAGLSARGFDRVLRVARTIADLADRSAVVADDVREAVRYRGAGNDA